MLQRQYDTSITVKVHSLRIEDKLQGHVGPSCRYIVRSSIPGGAELDETKVNPEEEVEEEKDDEEDEEDEEVFDDALAEFGVPGSPSSSEHGSFHRLFSGRSDLSLSQQKPLRQWEPELMNLVKEGTLQDMWLDAGQEDVSDFANMRLILRQIDSPDYDDTDMQVLSLCTIF